jgi:hypothetical protein
MKTPLQELIEKWEKICEKCGRQEKHIKAAYEIFISDAKEMLEKEKRQEEQMFVSRYFQPRVRILVEENIKDSNNTPEIFVQPEFGQILQVGDVIIFEDEEQLPEWILDSENMDELFDGAITLTQRIINGWGIEFYAKIS